MHTALRTSDTTVLIISAGEDAARGLLDHCASLAQVPVLSESVADETTMRIVLSNGSVIRSVPASQKQVRGKSVDLLLVDEGAFVEEEVLQAAKFTLLARPGAQLVIASTPYGLGDKFFAVAWRAGQRGVDGYSSHHWPSTVSPLVDDELLRMFRETCTPRKYRAEVLAEWVDDAGAYFPSHLIETAIEDYALIPPAEAGKMNAVAGTDWGKRRDVSACVLISAHPERGRRLLACLGSSKPSERHTAPSAMRSWPSPVGLPTDRDHLGTDRRGRWSDRDAGGATGQGQGHDQGHRCPYRQPL